MADVGGSFGGRSTNLRPVDSAHCLGDFLGVGLGRFASSRPTRPVLRSLLDPDPARHFGLAWNRCVSASSCSFGVGQIGTAGDSSPSRPAACCAFNDAAASRALAVHLVDVTTRVTRRSGLSSFASAMLHTVSPQMNGLL